MIHHLNKLNRNLDTYFELYNNIICNFNIEKNIFSHIQNVNTIKKFNNNFIGNMTEIIIDSNFKSQLIDIINIQLKMEFKNIKENHNSTIIKEKEDIENNENEDDNDNNIPIYNPSEDKYENFNLDKIKIFQSFTINNKYN